MFKLAILQMRSEKRAYDKNTNTIIDYMKTASENNADMLLLPECFITGYDLSISNGHALSDDDSHIKKLSDVARELEIGLVATALTKGKAKPQNSAFVMNKNGEILMKYSKVHTCDFADEKALESGKNLRSAIVTE